VPSLLAGASGYVNIDLCPFACGPASAFRICRPHLVSPSRIPPRAIDAAYGTGQPLLHRRVTGHEFPASAIAGWGAFVGSSALGIATAGHQDGSSGRSHLYGWVRALRSLHFRSFFWILGFLGLVTRRAPRPGVLLPTRGGVAPRVGCSWLTFGQRPAWAGPDGGACRRRRARHPGQ
jgi:hypothetical protein